jgi:phenylalanyl-tRNA synthetase beta chain
MKISLNWLKNYVDLSVNNTAIEEALTLIGFEVEGVHVKGIPPLTNCVVGEILSSEQHPNADRLSVCSVNVGLDEPQQIVCGAKNYKVGDRVPVALPGCVLPGDFTIKKSNLRGIKSNGMMCSTKELGLGDDHGGLLILEQRPEIGTPINDVFKDNDVIFDIEVTPNRPDCLSHVGIARELSAYFQSEFTYPFVQNSPGNPLREKHQPLLKSVSCSELDRCPYYSAWSVLNVKVGPSPEWLQKALTAIGLRPINNVVDVTNFVLHELGQPLHAFDAAKIANQQIIVRIAAEGETIQALDGKKYTLTSNDLVIADAVKPIAIAGIMGGTDTEVSEETTNIVLEAAYFGPARTRASSKRLGLSSDSSYRFERGIDPKGVEFAALRALDLILEVTGGELAGPGQILGHPPLVERAIELSPKWVNERLGFEVERTEIIRILESLQLTVKERHNDAHQTLLEVQIPSFRLDLDRPVDLLEEILRIYGTDKIPSALVNVPGYIAGDAPVSVFVAETAQMLAANRFNECVHYSMRCQKEVAFWTDSSDAAISALANPLASDQSHLRSSLIPGLLDALALNQNRLTQPRRFFETGRCFIPVEGKLWETIAVGFTIVEPKETSWKPIAKPDFEQLRPLIDSVLDSAGFAIKHSSEIELITQKGPWQIAQSAQWGSFSQGVIAQWGLLDVQMTDDRDIEGVVFAGHIVVLPEKLRLSVQRPKYQPYSSFPPAQRDLSLIVDAAIPAGVVEKDLLSLLQSKSEGFALENIRVFDVYQGTGIEDGKKSVTFSLQYRSSERTLQDSEVNQAFQSLQKTIQENTVYRIRS